MKAILSVEQSRASDRADGGRGFQSKPAWLDLLHEALRAVDFGLIQIKVHGGEVVQIETTRKIRVPSSASNSPFLPTAPAEDQQPNRK